VEALFTLAYLDLALLLCKHAMTNTEGTPTAALQYRRRHDRVVVYKFIINSGIPICAYGASQRAAGCTPAIGGFHRSPEATLFEAKPRTRKDELNTIYTHTKPRNGLFAITC
jgi:hypothetical protein